MSRSRAGYHTVEEEKDVLQNENEAKGSAYVKIKKAFLRDKKTIIAEAVTSISWASLTTAYLDENTNWYVHPFFLTTAMITLNFINRAFPLRLEECARECGVQGQESVNRALRSVLYSLFAPIVLLHEAGHALTSNSLFQDSEAKVKIFPPFNGVTEYMGSKTTLTVAGDLFGQEASKTLVTAMGMGSVMIWICAALIAAQWASDKYPEAKSHLRALAASSIVQNFGDPLSAIATQCEVALDSCKLGRIGIPPAAIIFFMIGLVTLVQVSLSCCSRVSRHRALDHEEEIELVVEEKENKLEEKTEQATRLVTIHTHEKLPQSDEPNVTIHLDEAPMITPLTSR